jgi:hypothetical protein
VRRAGPLAIDDFVEIGWIVSVRSFQQGTSSRGET